MERAGIGAATLGWPGLDWARFGLAALGPAGLVLSKQARLGFAQLSCARQEQTELRWVWLSFPGSTGLVWNWLLLLGLARTDFSGQA